MTTHLHDHDRTKATLADVNHRDGPYWADYQATRARDDISHDPDHVPDWYLKKTVVERLKDARVVVECTEVPVRWPLTHAQRLRAVWEAFGVVVEFLETAGTAQLASESADEALAVLLGGLDAALERERAWDTLRAENELTLQEFAALAPDTQRKLIKERECSS